MDDTNSACNCNVKGYYSCGTALGCRFRPPSTICFFCICVRMLYIHWRCMHECHVYMAFIYVRTYVHSMSHTCVYIYTYVNTYVPIRIRIYFHIYTYVYVSITCMYDIPCSGASAIYGTRWVFRFMILFSGPASLPSIEDMCNLYTCCMLARHFYFSWLCVYIYIRTYVRTYIYVSISIYVYIYMYVCMYICEYVRTYVRTYVRIYI